MTKSVESSRGELATVRTGRASPHLLDRIVVDYYGNTTPLKQLANIATTDARVLTVTPFDKGSLGGIEKAIQESDVGLTPSNDGNVIRLQLPALTEDRRRQRGQWGTGRPGGGGRAVREGVDCLLLLDRELDQAGGGGRGPDDDVRRADRERDAGA